MLLSTIILIFAVSGFSLVTANICNPNPCRNGGKCVNGILFRKYICVCNGGFTGNNCEISPKKCKLDLTFVTDSSSSMCGEKTSCSNWDSSIKLIHSIVDGLKIGPDDTQVALMPYSTAVGVENTLLKYIDKSSLLAAVDSLHYTKSSPGTSGALGSLVSKVFRPELGDRQDAPNILIILTDVVPPVDVDGLIYAAQAVQDAGIKVIAVGVGDDIDEEVLQKISSPTSKVGGGYFIMDTYQSLESIGPQILELACSF